MLRHGRGPLVIAHRGASADAVDNSIDAFEKAIGAGADMIEFDVRRTRDGQLIAFHDATVGRVPVGRQTHEELTRRLGYPPPLLEDVLALTAGRIALDVELKEDGYVDRVLDAVLRHHAADRIVVTSFHDAVVRQAKAREGIRAGLLLGRTHVTVMAPLTRARRCGADFVGLYHGLVRRGLLHRAHQAGFPAIVWTVNEERALRRLLADPRVHGVVTDVPAHALALR